MDDHAEIGSTGWTDPRLGSKPRSGRHGDSATSASGIPALAALVFAVLLGVSTARGQTAPAGNAHPTPQAVSTPGEGLANPFGEADWSGAQKSADERRAAAEAKAKLAAAVDLAPLRDLAVFHSGRVKIIDTLARETVRRITGRTRYREDTHRIDGSGATATMPLDAKRGVDPLFVLLDLMIDPAHYADRPLIHVEYVPLRRAFVELAFPGDKERQDRWFSLARLSPRIVATIRSGLQEKHAFDPSYRRAFGDIGMAMQLYESGPMNLEMVAPPTLDEPYRHLSTLPEDAPARRAAHDLGRAWRAADAAGVNAAVKTLAAELPKISAGVYPAFKRGLELSYNRVNAFEWGFWLYGLALLALILAFGTERRWLFGIGIGALTVAVSLHGLGFVARCFIADRFAIQNQFESMTGLSLFANAVGLGIMVLKRQWLFGAAAAGVGFLVLITATQTDIPGVNIEREAAILNTSVLLKYHVTTVLSSYGLISLGFIISVFYLCTHYAAKLRGAPGTAPISVELAASALNLGPDEPHGPSRTLRDLDRAQMTVLQLAFWTLGVGILLGAWWADHSWGRFWAFDPKETWALVTWIVYLIVIHVRVAGGFDRGLVTAWLSVLGFIVMCWTYFGVNLLLPGLHAYA